MCEEGNHYQKHQRIAILLKRYFIECLYSNSQLEDVTDCFYNGIVQNDRRLHRIHIEKMSAEEHKQAPVRE
jgi:hypothetical protein